MERRQTAGDGDPPRRRRDQYLPVGPGTGGLFGHLSARAGRVPPTAAQRITGGTQEEREEGKSAPEDFLAFAREKVKGYKRRGQIGTFRSYRTTCRKFTAFIEETYGREEVPFGALEAELFREFRTYCYEERGSGTNTVGRELGIVCTLVRHAMKEGKLSAYPFEHIVTYSEPSRKELLTPEEVERIADLEIDEDSPAAEARRWFLFAYYAGGMRFSDVATLQWQHIR
ncbi:site-specific recombinase XerD [Salinibacter ruber]|nr:site-specific recombinase XerD [Salinibacter ruber]